MKFDESIHILYVEDDDIDIQSLQRSFKKAELKNRLYTAFNGVEALKLLRETVPTPRIVLLDINMPKMNGLEFLTEIRKDERLKNLTVFVLTTSNQDRDVVQAHQHAVAGYLVKPPSVKELTAAVESLKALWMISEFPPPNATGTDG